MATIRVEDIGQDVDCRRFYRFDIPEAGWTGWEGRCQRLSRELGDLCMESR